MLIRLEITTPNLIPFLQLLLLWTPPVLSQFGTHFQPGRSVIVNLFEWKWVDVAKECTEYLGPNDFGGVQVSPVTENVLAKGRPWWERYQPISYEMDSRSGSEKELREMVYECNEAGVRVYVDVVLNHMAAGVGEVVGTGGRLANPPLLEYPIYNEEDFNGECHIDNNRSDFNALRNCRLTSFPDLNQGSEFVQIQMVEFLNKLIDYGVAGFHIDAAKYMWPMDLKGIFDQLKNLNTQHGFLPYSRPTIMMDVFDLLNADQINKYEYQSLGLVSDYAFTQQISRVFSRQQPLSTVKRWPSNRDFLPADKSLIFIETHLTERKMYPNGNPIGNLTLTTKDRKGYLMAISFLLATNYGIPRLFSGYEFSAADQGPPVDSQGKIRSPAFTWTGQCSNGFNCQHRWPEVQRMVRFRNSVASSGSTALNNWADNGVDQIAFCVGTGGFVAINGYNLAKFDSVLQVCLPEGVYCDIITGKLSELGCTGAEVIVNGTGFARILIPANHRVGVLAIYDKERLM